MPRLVTKFKYLKPGAGGRSVGGYARYIATREGVERIDDSHRHAPATQKQQALIEKILRDLPDTKQSHEYRDYQQERTVGNASEFISMAMEENLNAVANTKTYADYIATRPRAERFGSHGLFTDDGVEVQLSEVSKELNTELEQVLCFDGGIDAEQFVREKCAIFLILPEEDATKNFVASLMIQNLARELFSVANEHGGKLPNRAVFFCDELGTMPPFDILPLFSAGRSRRLTLVPIIQSLAQLEKNYGKEGAEILADNCQDTIFGGFAPNSQTAEVLSRNLGSRTVLSGSVTQGKDSNSQSLQMMERPLMSPDELKSMPKGSFVIMKTGTHPMKTKLKLFLNWGIRFEKPLEIPDRGSRPVHYAGKTELEQAILSECPLVYSEEPLPTQTTLKPVPMPEKTALKT